MLSNGSKRLPSVEPQALLANLAVPIGSRSAQVGAWMGAARLAAASSSFWKRRRARRMGRRISCRSWGWRDGQGTQGNQIKVRFTGRADLPSLAHSEACLWQSASHPSVCDNPRGCRHSGLSIRFSLVIWRIPLGPASAAVPVVPCATPQPRPRTSKRSLGLRRSVTTAAFNWGRTGMARTWRFECQSVSFECQWGCELRSLTP